MKRYILLLSFLTAFSGLQAQESVETDSVETVSSEPVVVDIKAEHKKLEKHLREARTLSAVNQSPNFENARKELEAAMESPVFEEHKAEVLLEAGNLEYRYYEVERNKPAKGGNIDYATLYPVTVKAFYYLSEAYDLYNIMKGKAAAGIKLTIQKKAWTLFNVTDGFRANAAYAFENKDWMTAHDCFGLFEKAVSSDVINGYASTNSRIRQQLQLYKNDSVMAHARYFRAISAIYMDSVSLAISELEQIKYDGFEQNVVLQELCSLYRETGEDEKFVKLLEEGAELIPNEPWYSRNLVNIYLDRKEYKTASGIIDRLIKLDPDNAENLALKGQFIELQGNDELALVFFERSYEINPDNCEINSHLGRVWYNRANRLEGELFDQRRYDEASEQSLPLYIKSADYYMRAFELDDRHLDKTIAKAIRTIRYKQFTKADCPNKDELIEQYNLVSRAYGMTEFPR